MQRKPDEQRALREALISAFIDEPTFRVFFRDTFDQDLNRVVNDTSVNFEVLLSDLITWAESEGKVDELVNAAVREKPGNALLVRFVAMYRTVVETEPPTPETAADATPAGAGPSDNASPRTPIASPAQPSERVLSNVGNVPSGGGDGSDGHPSYLSSRQVTRLLTKKAELDLNVRGYIASRDLLDICIEFRRKAAAAKRTPARYKTAASWSDFSDDLGADLDTIWNRCQTMANVVAAAGALADVNTGYAAARTLVGSSAGTRTGSVEDALAALKAAADQMWQAISPVPEQYRRSAEEDLSALGEILAGLGQEGTQDRQLSASAGPAAELASPRGLGQAGQGLRWPGQPDVQSTALGRG